MIHANWSMSGVRCILFTKQVQDTDSVVVLTWKWSFWHFADDKQFLEVLLGRIENPRIRAAAKEVYIARERLELSNLLGKGIWVALFFFFFLCVGKRVTCVEGSSVKHWIVHLLDCSFIHEALQMKHRPTIQERMVHLFSFPTGIDIHILIQTGWSVAWTYSSTYCACQCCIYSAELWIWKL